MKKDLSPEVERRRRLLTRTLPLAIIAIVAFALGAATGSSGSPEKDAATRFADAWSRDDFRAMYEELSPASRAGLGEADFIAAYEEAEAVADMRGHRFRSGNQAAIMRAA